MPVRAPQVCGHCNQVHTSRQKCPTAQALDRARKARFDARRPGARQRGYNAEWDKARGEFLTVYPTCRRCGSPASVVDHIKPHKGNQALFWNRSNWQSLCVHCHSSAKQSEERRQPRN
ncbi:HNH endonuclease signature motif containing protein [Cucumibacter marinus]|uniref:HNH endonuclease signature motif containing protein n=1 Tax=Cucumibacter marinus TaxID=1121252 RepID=UPI0004920B7F|nr:HNH endonuclease [Cucumibacter marinus]